VLLPLLSNLKRDRRLAARAHLALLHLALPHLALPHLAFLHLALLHLALPHLAFLHLALPHLALLHLAFLHLAFLHLAFLHLAFPSRDHRKRFFPRAFQTPAPKNSTDPENDLSDHSRFPLKGNEVMNLQITIARMPSVRIRRLCIYEKRIDPRCENVSVNGSLSAKAL
jgi:hypothetical protein